MNDHRRTELLELFIHHIKLGSGFRSTINVWTIIIRLVYGVTTHHKMFLIKRGWLEHLHFITIKTFSHFVSIVSL